jgi:hypothetical protein
MKISLLTDAPKHNLALMYISAWYKKAHYTVNLNMPIIKADYTYASVLFEKNRKLFIADKYGGPAFGKTEIPYQIKKDLTSFKPDYDLYPHNDFSLGYTFRGCHRGCKFCKVPEIEDDFNHYSIWDFHDPKFKKICLLNNNTFFDPQWKETFEEIWGAKLSVIDENGYDLRLLNDEKADALKKTKWCGKLHFAWDRIQDESKIIRGLEILKAHKINNVHIYVLIGFDTSQDEDFFRCQKIVDFGFDPYVMPYNQSISEKRFKRFIDTFMWRKYKTIKEAWWDYR